MERRGKFFVFEGGEGSGKSTCAAYVYQTLKAEGRDVVLTREPGGSPFAELVRNVVLSGVAKDVDPLTIFEMFWLARADHLVYTIIPALNRGAIVLCDRFDGSTYAYQVVGQERPKLKKRFWQRRRKYLQTFVPDRYLVFDLDPEVGIARARARREATNHFDEQYLDFHQRVRAGFREFATSPGIPALFVDALPPKEVVQQHTLVLIRGLID